MFQGGLIIARLVGLSNSYRRRLCNVGLLNGVIVSTFQIIVPVVIAPRALSGGLGLFGGAEARTGTLGRVSVDGRGADGVVGREIHLKRFGHLHELLAVERGCFWRLIGVFHSFSIFLEQGWRTVVVQYDVSR